MVVESKIPFKLPARFATPVIPVQMIFGRGEKGMKIQVSADKCVHQLFYRIFSDVLKIDLLLVFPVENARPRRINNIIERYPGRKYIFNFSQVSTCCRNPDDIYVTQLLQGVKIFCTDWMVVFKKSTIQIGGYEAYVFNICTQFLGNEISTELSKIFINIFALS